MANYHIHPETNSIFPPMEEKLYEHLPQVFKWIIQADHKNPSHKKVTSIKEWTEWKATRENLRLGAQNLIKKQRGTGGGANSG